MAEDKKNGNGNGNDQDKDKKDEKKDTKMDRYVDPAKTIRSLLEKNKAQIMAALPGTVRPDQFSRIALTTIQRNPKLGKANPWSLLGAIMEAAQSGLSLDRAKREGDLVPYWNKNKKQYDVEFQPRYGGYIKMAHDSGKVSSIFARVVYDQEIFEIIYGDETKITHKPLPPKSRGEIRVGAYATAKLKDGTKQSEWLWEDELMEIRERSKGKDDGPWKEINSGDADEMRKKTAIRRLAKVLPLSPEWTRAATRDEYREAGIAFPSDLEVEAGVSDDPEMAGFGPPPEIKAVQGAGEGPSPADSGGGAGAGEGSGEPGDRGRPGIPEGAARQMIQQGLKDKQNQELGSITAGQKKMIGALLSGLGYKDDSDRHFALSRALSIEVRSAGDLSSAEASAVIDVLKDVAKAAGIDNGAGK